MAKETNYTPQEKKTLRKMFWNSGLDFCGFNMVKMEGNAFALTRDQQQVLEMHFSLTA